MRAARRVAGRRQCASRQIHATRRQPKQPQVGRRTRHGVVGVYLQLFVELVRRIGNPDRVARRKITSAESLREYVAEHSIEPVPRANCLTIDSEVNDADLNALKIIRHFGLSADFTQIQTLPS